MDMLKTPRDDAREKTCSIGEHREGKSVRNKAVAYSRPFACCLGVKGLLLSPPRKRKSHRCVPGRADLGSMREIQDWKLIGAFHGP